MTKEGKFDWNVYGSIRVPASVLKQLDDYKQKNGYTSRPQAIISAIERAEKINLVEEIRKMLYEFMDKDGKKIVREILHEL